MNELIDHIDDLISEEIDGIKAFGLCETITMDNHIAPVKDKKLKVSPDDKNQLTTYHKLLNGSYENKEEISFGKKFARVNNQRVRFVIFIQIDEDVTVIDEIINQFPSSLTIDGYNYIAIQNAIAINHDDEAIWQEEFDQAYLDRIRMKYRLYAIEYELQYQLCPVTQ